MPCSNKIKFLFRINKSSFQFNKTFIFLLGKGSKKSIEISILFLTLLLSIYFSDSIYESKSERKERLSKCGVLPSYSSHTVQPGYPWFAALKQQVINPDTGNEEPKIFRGGTIVSKKYIVTAAEIFYTERTELEEAWRQPDAWQAIPIAEIGYRTHIQTYNPDPTDPDYEKLFKWINVINIDIHPEYSASSTR